MCWYSVPQLHCRDAGTSIASHYLQPRIGSDIARFKGIAKALIERNGVEQAFVDAHTLGYFDYVLDVAGTSWAQITQATGLAAEDIYAGEELTVLRPGVNSRYLRIPVLLGAARTPHTDH